MLDHNNYLVVGDFNLHYGSNYPPHSYFYNLISLLSLKQHISFPTHTSGHILDLIITLTSSTLIPYPPNLLSLTTDHYSIMFSLNLPKLLNFRKSLYYRNLSSIIPSLFISDLINSPLTNSHTISSINHLLSSTLYKHSLTKTKNFTISFLKLSRIN